VNEFAVEQITHPEIVMSNSWFSRSCHPPVRAGFPLEQTLRHEMVEATMSLNSFQNIKLSPKTKV
jgi:hypothetical protein